MRHRKCGRKLNRDSSHRKAMFKNMLKSVIDYEIIKTTLPKAKELKKLLEFVINVSKKNNLSNKRLLYSMIGSRRTIKKLFDILGPRFLDRFGGYTRIIKCGFRNGDNALLSYVEILDRNINDK